MEKNGMLTSQCAAAQRHGPVLCATGDNEINLPENAAGVQDQLFK